MKTEIYNLIILDESGSMSPVEKQTIDGCNETINTIRSAQEQFADTQDHFVSIYVFQDNPKRPSHYIVKNAPVGKVRNITGDDYQPWGSTPLYDAVGSTLTDLKLTADKKALAIGAVTIITDGYENASRLYTREKVARMIDALKETGWTFNFIGANIDAKATARSLSIDEENALQFDNDVEGTKEMFVNENKARMAYYCRSDMAMKMMTAEEEDEAFGEMPAPTRIEKARSKMKDAGKNYFDEL